MLLNSSPQSERQTTWGLTGTNLCALPVSCHFLPPNLWRNSPPPDQKIVVLDESTFDRSTVHGAAAPVVQGFVLIQVHHASYGESLALHGEREQHTLREIDGGARFPHRGWRATVEAAGVAAVGGSLRCLQVGTRPDSAMALRPPMTAEMGTCTGGELKKR